MSEQPTLFLVVVDEDRKQFTVEGPLTDGAAWKRAIEKARDDGRNIKSCDIGSTSRVDAIAEWQRHYGLLPIGRLGKYRIAASSKPRNARRKKMGAMTSKQGAQPLTPLPWPASWHCDHSPGPVPRSSVIGDPG
jgi:hypothetical protein